MDLSTLGGPGLCAVAGIVALFLARSKFIRGMDSAVGTLIRVLLWAVVVVAVLIFIALASGKPFENIFITAFWGLVSAIWWLGRLIEMLGQMFKLIAEQAEQVGKR